MVSLDRDRYVPADAGAPPVPPPGGYRGRKRSYNPDIMRRSQPVAAPTAAQLIESVSTPAAASVAAPAPAPSTKRGRATAAAPTPELIGAQRALGTVALAIAVGFAAVLVLMVFTAGPEAFWGRAMLFLQLIVIGVGVYAVTKPPGRFRGTIALAITALVNVLTISMLAMVLG